MRRITMKDIRDRLPAGWRIAVRFPAYAIATHPFQATRVEVFGRETMTQAVDQLLAMIKPLDYPAGATDPRPVMRIAPEVEWDLE